MRNRRNMRFARPFNTTHISTIRTLRKPVHLVLSQHISQRHANCSWHVAVCLTALCTGLTEWHVNNQVLSQTEGKQITPVLFKHADQYVRHYPGHSTTRSTNFRCRLRQPEFLAKWNSGRMVDSTWPLCPKIAQNGTYERFKYRSWNFRIQTWKCTPSAATVGRSTPSA